MAPFQKLPFISGLFRYMTAKQTCRFADPLHASGERFVWDYWHVPDQYTLLRTPADQFFPEESYQQLEDALLEYGEEQLGCRGISPIWLSYYVDGCRQVSHHPTLLVPVPAAMLKSRATCNAQLLARDCIAERSDRLGALLQHVTLKVRSKTCCSWMIAKTPVCLVRSSVGHTRPDSA